MAARNFTTNSKTLVRDVVTLWGSAVGAAASALTSVKGLGVTIARTGVGLYTITLANKYNGILMFSAEVQDTAGTPSHWIVTRTSALTSGTSFTIKLYSGATTVAPTAADLPTTAKIFFRIDLSNSAQVPAGY